VSEYFAHINCLLSTAPPHSEHLIQSSIRTVSTEQYFEPQNQQEVFPSLSSKWTVHPRSLKARRGFLGTGIAVISFIIPVSV